MKKIHYFIFGEYITDLYESNGFESALKYAEDEGNFTLATFEPSKDSPAKLLAQYDGNDGFVEINKKQYKQFSKFLISEK